jgi:hypothetical protein
LLGSHIEHGLGTGVEAVRRVRWNHNHVTNAASPPLIADPDHQLTSADHQLTSADHQNLIAAVQMHVS